MSVLTMVTIAILFVAVVCMSWLINVLYGTLKESAAHESVNKMLIELFAAMKRYKKDDDWSLFEGKLRNLINRAKNLQNSG